jgi:hypothetical protein
MPSPYGCIAHPCPNKRKKGSGFCTKHKAEHEKSPWVKAWRKYQDDIAKVGKDKAYFIAPKKGN